MDHYQATLAQLECMPPRMALPFSALNFTNKILHTVMKSAVPLNVQPLSHFPNHFLQLTLIKKIQGNILLVCYSESSSAHILLMTTLSTVIKFLHRRDPIL